MNIHRWLYVHKKTSQLQCTHTQPCYSATSLSRHRENKTSNAAGSIFHTTYYFPHYSVRVPRALFPILQGTHTTVYAYPPRL